MHKTAKILSIVIILFFCSCTKKPTLNDCFEKKKAFISLDTYIKVQNKSKNDPPLFPTDTLRPAICFDSFTSFNQIDSLRASICKQDQVTCGMIPLKYCFNNDTILLPAFPFVCSYHMDKSFNIIKIKVTDKTVTFDFANLQIGISESRLNDSLNNYFLKEFKPFFNMQHEIVEKVKDTLKTKQSVFNYFSCYNGFTINIELEKDDQLKKIKAPIDIILTEYLSALRNSINDDYKKELCELSTSELKLFTSYFFLIFEIHKK